jgi:transposase
MMLHKFDRLDDNQWNVVSNTLRAAGGNLSQNTRDHVDGILFLMQYDLPWRDLDASFGKWNSVYVRFMRWAAKGVLDKLVVAFKKLNLTKRWNTKWVEYSRSQGAKAAPTRREIIARSVVEGSSSSLKDAVATVEQHNFSKSKPAQPRVQVPPQPIKSDEPNQLQTMVMVGLKAVRTTARQKTTLTAIRDRRERRRQLAARLT